MPAARILIVDDEPLARDCVRVVLERLPQVEVAGECADGQSAIDAIRRLQPDLVLLDVQMPGEDGFGVIEAIGRDAMPAVVFITAYDAHAIRAFEIHALDYVLKPFDDTRLQDAVLHAIACLHTPASDALARQLAALLDARAPRANPAARRVTIREQDRIRYVAIDDVDWFEAEGNYVRLHMGRASEVIRSTLAALERQLDPSRFARIHRSTIVNLDRITEVQPWTGGDYIAILSDGRSLRVSRSHREALLKPIL